MKELYVFTPNNYGMYNGKFDEDGELKFCLKEIP